MTILYEGFLYSGSLPIAAYILWIIGLIALIMFIISLKKNQNDLAIMMLIGGIACGLIGGMFYSDDRIPIVKAIINEGISWQEVHSKYEFKTQEGNIYTFKVLNVTNEEWELYLNK